MVVTKMDGVSFIKSYKKEVIKLVKLVTDDTYERYMSRFLEMLEDYKRTRQSILVSDNALNSSDEECRPTTSKQIDRDALYAPPPLI